MREKPYQRSAEHGAVLQLARVIAAQAAELCALRARLAAMESGAPVTSDKRGLSEAKLPALISANQSLNTVFDAAEALRSSGVDPADIAASFAANTRRAYRAAWRAFMNYCGEHNLNALPATPLDIAAYLKHRAARGAKMSTVRLQLAAIVQAHRIAGLELDRDAPALHFALKAMAREYGIASEGKAALSVHDIEAMLHTTARDLAGARDRAILLLGFAGAFRRSEIAALDVPDIAWHRDGIRVRVRRSKTDQVQLGADVGILYGRRAATCPVRALKHWLELSGITFGPIFRAVIHGAMKNERLCDRSIYDLVKRCAARAGLDASTIGAHSMRSGHITTALDNGGDLVRAKEQARHSKLDTTIGYKRKTDIFRNNTSGKLGL